MMTGIVNWTGLNQVHIYEWFSPELKKKAEDLNKRIEGIFTSRRQTDEMLGAIEAADVGQVDFDNLVFAPAHAASAIALLQRELELRRDLVEFYAEREPERRKEEEVARKAHEDAGKKVTEALVKIGYIQNSNPSQRVIGRIQPGWIMEHPSVFAALGRLREIQSRESFQQHEHANQAAIEQVTTQLERFRSKAMGQLGPAK
jgi:hypothetical protein